jgi:predicted nucleic acid-binding protein
MNVVDSSGWIEFFTAGASGPLFKSVIEQRDQLLVPVINLYEVHKIIGRKLPAGAVTSCLDVMRLGRVIDVTDRRAVAAADIAVKHKLAMADAVIYSMAREFAATLWTQNADYDGLEGVKFFAKPY